MNTWMRRISGIVAALLLLAGVLTALALWRGSEMLSGVLEAQLQTRLAPTLRLGMPLEWQLQPPQLVARDVSLAETSGLVVMKLAALRVMLDGTSLVQGRLDIASVDVDGLELILERDPEGEWNAADWLRSAPDAAAPAAVVPVGQVRITNGQVRVVGEDSLAITDISLTAGPLRPATRGEFTFSARVDAPPAAVVDLKIDAAGQFLADFDRPVLEHLTLEGVGDVGAWSVSRAVAQAGRVELMTDTGAVQASGLTLDLAAHGEAGQIAAQATLTALVGGAVSWRGEALRVQVQGQQAQRSVSVTLDSNEVRFDEGGWALPTMTLEAASSGSLPVARLQVSGAAQFDAGQGQGLAQLALMVREAHTVVPHPADASATLELSWSGHVRHDFASGSAGGDVVGRFDQSRFDGRWVFEPRASTPFKVTASLDRLDLDRYLPPAQAGAATADPLDLALWRNWPVSADLHVGELRVQGFVSQQARVRLGDSATDVR